jgi:hypothetical protein
MSLASWVREGLCAQSGHPAERAGSAMARPCGRRASWVVGRSSRRCQLDPTGAHQRRSTTVWRSCFAVCEHELEDVVAKRRSGRYILGERGWIKTKKPERLAIRARARGVRSARGESLRISRADFGEP